MNDSGLLPLLSRIARPTFFPELHPDPETAQIVSLVGSAPETFVPPSVSPTSEPGDVRAAIVLVSASAAVGKTQLARYLAAETGNPLWDLSGVETRTGSLFYSGTLTGSYADADYSTVIQMIKRGEATVLVDALDEALVNAGVDTYGQSIANLASIARDCVGTCASFVLFGRTESLDYAAVALSERGVKWQRLEIDFFAPEQRRAFVHVVAANTKGHTATPAEIDKFYDICEKMVSSDVDSTLPLDRQADAVRELDSFLGYAPVLDALGRLAATKAGRRDLIGAGPAGQDLAVWSVLGNVMREILAREITKLKSQDTKHASEYQYSFSAEEQLRLLFRQTAKPDVRFSPHVREDEKSAMSEKIENQLRDHPFVRSGSSQLADPFDRFRHSAFRDFGIASLLLSPDEGEQIGILLLMEKFTIAPSPLLLRLLLSAPGHIRVPVAALGRLLDSAATPLGARQLETAVTITDSSGQEFALRLDAIENSEPLATCTVTGRRSDLVLGGSLAHSALYLRDEDLRIETATEFALGPDVFVDCKNFVCVSDSVRVLSGDERGRVIIRAARIASSTRSIVASGGALEIQVPGDDDPPYPWSLYRNTWTGSRFDYSELYYAASQLRRLCSWFLRKSMSGPLTYPSTGFDTILSKNRAPVAWATFLKARNMLVKGRGPYYNLSIPPPIQSVQLCDLGNRSLLQLVEEFLTWNSASADADGA